MKEKKVLKVKDFVIDNYTALERRKGSAMLMMALSAAAVTAVIGVSVAQLVNTELRVSNSTESAAEARTKALASIEKYRSTPYSNLTNGTTISVIAGTSLKERVTITDGPNIYGKDSKNVKVEILDNNNQVVSTLSTIRSSATTTLVVNDTGGENPSADVAISQKAAVDAINAKATDVEKNLVKRSSTAAVGSNTQAVYVNSNGIVTPITANVGNASNQYVYLSGGSFVAGNYTACTCSSYVKAIQQISVGNIYHGYTYGGGYDYMMYFKGSGGQAYLAASASYGNSYYNYSNCNCSCD